MIENMKNLKSALESYIKAYTIDGKYVGNPNYLEEYERISMYLDAEERGCCSKSKGKTAKLF